MGMMLNYHRKKRLEQWKEASKSKALDTNHNIQFKDQRSGNGPIPIKRKPGRPKKNAISNRNSVNC